MWLMQNHNSNTLLIIVFITQLVIQTHVNEIILIEAVSVTETKIETLDPHELEASLHEKRETKCSESITTVFNERVKCKDQLIFEDNFENLNETIWGREVKIPQEPDFEFCVYRRDEGIVKTHDGFLQITPRILEEAYGDNAVYVGKMVLADCTSQISEECQRKATAYHILQPVISSRLTTKNFFNFQYGKIEISAKFPNGDWLFPELELLPRFESNDYKFAFAEVNLGLARGNEKLYSEENYSQEYSGKLLEFGLRFGVFDHYRYRNVTKFRRAGAWSNDFHKYTTLWTENGFSFFVDDSEVGVLNQTETSNFSTRRKRVPPFEQEFYLRIGLGVGGLQVFPDNVTNGQYFKPWKNLGAKSMLNFWEAKDRWLPSWKRQNGVDTSLKVKSIQIWSV